MMHTVWKVSPEKWNVGQNVTYYQQGTPYETFDIVATFDNSRTAVAFCHYLNGGAPEFWPYDLDVANENL